MAPQRLAPIAFFLCVLTFIYCCSLYYCIKNSWIVTVVPQLSTVQDSQTILLSVNISIDPSWLVNVPTIPTISIDENLIILSANAGRRRYGGCITFVMVLPEDIPRVINRSNLTNRTSSIDLDLSCMFHDGSQTSAHSIDIPIPNGGVSMIDCSLNTFARHQLWKQKRSLRVFLVSHKHRNQSIPLAQALISLPQRIPQKSTFDEEILTLCTSPLRSTFTFLPQWIEYHRLVGFRKFIIYNTSDTNKELPAILDTYSRASPGLIDVVQWNFDHLHLKDWHGKRYFQVEALHDCLFRYGDYSDWLGIIDLDEYIVPLPPYKRVDEYLKMNFKRAEIGSIILQSLFFCGDDSKLTEPKNRLVIEEFTIRANKSIKIGRSKYLCRPQFILNLSIHRQQYGLPSRKPLEKDLLFAHYITMTRRRTFAECGVNQTVNDTRVGNLYGKGVHKRLSALEKFTGRL